jgi:AI-2 transport protein TqsA
VLNVNVGAATRWGLNALIMLSVSVALYLGRSIFVPLFMAVLLAAMLWPLVRWLHKHGPAFPGLCIRETFPFLRPCLWRLRLPWGVACLFSVGVLVVVVLLVAVGFSLSVSKFVLDVGNYDKQKTLYINFREKAVSLSPTPVSDEDLYFHKNPEESAVFKNIKSFFNPENETFRSLVRDYFWSSSDVFWQSILVMFVMLFLLVEGRMLTRHLAGIFGPSEGTRTKAVAALNDMANQIRSYLVWRTIINFAMAIFLGLFYHALGLSQAWTWALLTAVLWYVPYLGPILAGVPPTLDAFLTCDPWTAVGVLVLYTVVVVLEGYFIVPVVMGRSMELNATTVMLACLFWQLVWGVGGLFLAMPLMAAVKTVCSHVPDWQPWANLMGTREETPAAKSAPVIEAFEDTQLLSGAEMHAALAAAKAQGRERRSETGERVG